MRRLQDWRVYEKRQASKLLVRRFNKGRYSDMIKVGRSKIVPGLVWRGYPSIAATNGFQLQALN